jgi:hypothetical protein
VQRAQCGQVPVGSAGLTSNAYRRSYAAPHMHSTDPD